MKTLTSMKLVINPLSMPLHVNGKHKLGPGASPIKNLQRKFYAMLIF